MIFEAFVDLFFGLADLILSALGNLEAPAWLVGLAGQMDQLVSAGASLGVWVPWPALAACIASVLACFAISFAVRIVRVLLSLVTGGGGSAA